MTEHLTTMDIREPFNDIIHNNYGTGEQLPPMESVEADMKAGILHIDELVSPTVERYLGTQMAHKNSSPLDSNSEEWME